MSSSLDNVDSEAASEAAANARYQSDKKILKYIYLNQLLKDSIHIRTWEALIDKEPEILDSPMDLKVYFHCEILKNIHNYNLTFEEKVYFAGHPHFTGQQSVMENNDFLHGRDYDLDPEQLQPNSTNELDHFWDARPLSDAPIKITVQEAIHGTNYMIKWPLFMKAIYSAIINGSLDEILNATEIKIRISDICDIGMPLEFASHIFCRELIEAKDEKGFQSIYNKYLNKDAAPNALQPIVSTPIPKSNLARRSFSFDNQSPINRLPLVPKSKSLSTQALRRRSNSSVSSASPKQSTVTGTSTDPMEGTSTMPGRQQGTLH